MRDNTDAFGGPWYRMLNRAQWRVLIAANLGWLFDGFEIYALFLTVGFALHQLLDAVDYAAIPRYAGYVLATTVFGWATGGVIGGIVADYIGRKRTMILAILAYSLTTGLRVGPESLSRITKSSEHEADRGQTKKRERVSRQILKILGQTATAT